jgi:hypothetical protein
MSTYISSIITIFILNLVKIFAEDEPQLYTAVVNL